MKLLIDSWLESRKVLREIEEREHPDIIDRYGRVWVWKDKSLYTHDGCLAFPDHMIEGLDLPSAELADNPNYDLCGICTKEWED